VPADELPKRILVVEDDEDSAELLAEMLERKGYEVAIAHSGADALEVAKAVRPHVVFLDLGLPDIDGRELCPRMLAVCEPPVRMVALSGYGGGEVQARLLEAGFERCLLKPANLEALVSAAEGSPWPA
jgi:CheY-like chemotaxis protein